MILRKSHKVIALSASVVATAMEAIHTKRLSSKAKWVTEQKPAKLTSSEIFILNGSSGNVAKHTAVGLQSTYKCDELGRLIFTSTSAVFFLQNPTIHLGQIYSCCSTVHLSLQNNNIE